MEMEIGGASTVRRTALQYFVDSSCSLPTIVKPAPNPEEDRRPSLQLGVGLQVRDRTYRLHSRGLLRPDEEESLAHGTRSCSPGRGSWRTIAPQLHLPSSVDGTYLRSWSGAIRLMRMMEQRENGGSAVGLSTRS